ncbi:MAG: hypothetical protein QXD15_04165 [Thermoplasmata archaeon]
MGLRAIIITYRRYEAHLFFFLSPSIVNIHAWHLDVHEEGG